VTTELLPTAQLALDAILHKPTRGIPTWSINPMEWRMIDRLAGVPEGTYQRDPVRTYHRMHVAVGCCLVDQWIPENPLTMGSLGFDSGAARGATTAAEEVTLDGMRIDGPEAVVEHLERYEFPRLRRSIAAFDEEAASARILAGEADLQRQLGPTMLKTGYGFVWMPILPYQTYGYEAYLSAFALYPDVMERHFSLQGDLCVLQNRAAARAYVEGRLPPLFRLDYDLAGSRGTLVSVRALDRLWFPHLARCLEPVVRAGVTLIWHCDGNLMEMVPRLLDVGVKGFQGFQYEAGMDYAGICRMKARDGDHLTIIAGVSVTRTLPFGSPQSVRDEMRWLVENGPRTGLVLGCSSSITPGVPWENLQALVDGFRHYREVGR